MKRKIIGNSIALFIGTEVFFYILILSSINFLHINTFGVSSGYAKFFHFFFILGAILFGLMQLLFYNKKLKSAYKYILCYLCGYILYIVVGGLLFSFLDMCEGYFVTGTRLFNKLIGDQYLSFNLGNNLILQSFPFNLLVFAFSFFLLYRSRVFCKKTLNKENKVIIR